MKTTHIFSRTLIATFVIMMTFACQKDADLATVKNDITTESRLRFSAPTCTSVLGSEADRDIILNGPEHLLKWMYNEGLKVPGIEATDGKWELISVCADAYVSFSPKGDLFAEASGFDNYSLQDARMKIVASPFENSMILLTGKNEDSWKITYLDVTTYRNRIVLIVQKSSAPGFNTKVSGSGDFALVTINLHTNLREINEYNTAKGSISVIGFSFGG